MTMDIYILHGGKEIGPLSEVTTQTLLRQGTVLITDLAWRPGMPQWIPLHSVLYPNPADAVAAAAPEPEPVPVPEVPAGEAPTARQRAFLSFMAIPVPSGFTREQAALAVTDAMEDPKLVSRLARWNSERFQLHPDLFAEEIQARKETRPEQFLEIARKEGGEYFPKITKAHCQVLMNYLDMHFPNWDASAKEATWNYFFPAIEEKFPMLVSKAAKGKFTYPKGPKVAPELSRHAQIPKPNAAPRPVFAAVRGLFIGALILGALYLGNEELGRRNALQKAAGENAPADPAAIEPLQAAPAAGQPRLAVQPAVPKAAAETPVPAAAEIPAAAAADPAMSAPVELAPAPVEAAPPPPKTNVLITKPVDVQLPFGRAVLQAGMQFKIIARDATHITVLYGKDNVLVPIASTDAAGTAAGPAPAAAPLAPAAPTAPTPTAPPPTSLF